MKKIKLILVYPSGIILNDVKWFLERNTTILERYQLIGCRSALDAIDELKSGQPGDVSLIVTDALIPPQPDPNDPLNGLNLIIKETNSRFPNCNRLLYSCSTFNDRINHAMFIETIDMTGFKSDETLIDSLLEFLRNN